LTKGVVERLSLRPMPRVIIFLLVAMSGLISTSPAHANLHTLLSPDGTIRLEVSIGEAITYEVFFHEKRIIPLSTFSLEFAESPALGRFLEITEATSETVEESWEPVYGKHATIQNHYNELDLSLLEEEFPGRGLQLTFRAYDDGVAFRYRITERNPKKDIKLIHENSYFNFDENHTVWMADYNAFHSHQEKEYRKMRLSDINERSIVGMPLLIEVADVGYVAITEANLKDWAGMYLTSSNRNNGQNAYAIKTTLPPIPGSEPVPELFNEPLKVVRDLPATSPWRVMMLSKEPGALLESELLMNLSDPCELEDTAWIHPGKCAWDHWWSGDVRMDTETIKEYIDFASEMEFPYMLIDWQWYGEFDRPDADITQVNPAIDMPEILAYAKSKDVRCWLWLWWTDADRNYEEAFALYEEWGIAGVKIDFMQRDDQEMVNWYHKIVKCAAEHHLMVNFHGAYKPTGFLRRAYPNLMTREGVFGNEQNKWRSRCTPEHNVTLAFTRNLLGEMDFTPGGFLNRSMYEFKVTTPTQVMGTRCHQLAMFVVYDSPITTVCDHPAHYRGQPGVEFLKEVPATSDDLRVLSGEVGKYIVVARKSGDRWFIGAMGGNRAQEIQVTLDMLDAGSYEAVLFEDAPDADVHAEKLVKSERRLENGDLLNIRMAPGGGFTAILSKD
jgi:alpha-glucosidase